MTVRIETSRWAWALMRKSFAVKLAEAGAVPCWRCGELVTPEMPWSLGHIVDRALGGQDEDGLAIEHRRCSDRSGGRLGAARRYKDQAARRPEHRDERVTAPQGVLW